MAAFGPVSPIKSHDMAVEHAASDRLMAVPGRGYHNHVEGHFYLSPNLRLLEQAKECLPGGGYATLLQEIASIGTTTSHPILGFNQSDKHLPMKVHPICIRPPPGLDPPPSPPLAEGDESGCVPAAASESPSQEDTQDISSPKLRKKPAKGKAKARPKPLPPGPCVGQGQSGKATCKFYFVGYDSEKHKAFELVPRIIGRDGCNMREIATDKCKLRIRGRASGHFDVQRNGVLQEAQAPLQIVLSSNSGVELELAKQKVEALLSCISVHFYRCCRKMGWTPPAQLYKVL